MRFLTWLALAALFGVTLASGADAAAEHAGGHEAPNWKVFGLAVLNLGILIFVLLRFARKPISDFLFQRSESIRSALSDAQAKLAEADAENTKLRERLAQLDRESREIVELARRQAQGEGERMQQRARENVERIREEAQRVADMEIARARQALREEAAALATTLAGELLRERIRPEDDRRLLDEFVTQVSNGGAH
jgi:F-type H+-transporting ATPase subunit b